MSKAHRDYFNKLAPEWDELMPQSDTLKVYLERFDIQSGDTVLDIGAGTGRMTQFLRDLASPGGQIIAQDIAEDMLALARKKFGDSHIEYVCNNTCNLSFQKNSFDKILCFSAFPHFTDQTKALQEMARVLKPHGKILILHLADSKGLNTFHSTLDGAVSRDWLPESGIIKSMFESASLIPLRIEENTALYWAEACKS